MSAEEIHSLINGALGKEKADLVIKEGNLVNVYTGELLESQWVSVKKGKIVYVGKDGSHTVGGNTEVIDAKGKVLVPGFIDTHMHLDTFQGPLEEFLRLAILGGTTAVVVDTFDIGNVLGYRGVIGLLEGIKGQPIKCYALAPMLIPPIPFLEESSIISEEEMEKLLELDEIVGSGETMWPCIVDGNKEALQLFAKTLAKGKKLEGHSAGAKGNKLVAYIASGISSCHEPIKEEEVVERLRLGIHVMVREGSIRRDLEAISKIIHRNIDFRRMILASDGIDPKDMLEYGYMDYIVQKAINLGFDPIKAIQMASLNAAEHFSLDKITGGIAPGKWADILIIPDLKTIKPEYVISNGRIAAKDKELLIKPRKCVYPEEAYRSIKLTKTFGPEDFMLIAKGGKKELKVRVIEIISNMITREVHEILPVSNGFMPLDVERDILKVSVIDRHRDTAESFTSFVKGFGMKSGAFASSFSWEMRSPIIVVGCDECDMALAVNRIKEIQGGVIVCQRGKILEELPLPIGGYISDLSAESLAEKLEGIKKALKDLGSPLPNPFLTLQTLPGTAFPYFRIIKKGLVDIKTKTKVELIVS